VGPAGELAGGRARGEGQDADEAVLELPPFGGRRGAGEHLEPLVELERVDRDRHGVLPVLAQALRERDRDGRLADARRPEDCDDGLSGARHRPEYRR
jgi:hypothetical protein